MALVRATQCVFVFAEFGVGVERSPGEGEGEARPDSSGGFYPRRKEFFQELSDFNESSWGQLGDTTLQNKAIACSGGLGSYKKMGL